MSEEEVLNGPHTVIVDKKSEGNCMTDLPIEKVTVYKDKAEIIRVAKIDISKTQQIELCFEQLPASIDPNSIRVDVEDKMANILDVTFNCKPANQTSSQTERLDQISKMVHQLKLELESLNAKKARCMKQKSVLDVFTDTLMGKLNQGDNKDGSEENKEDQTKVQVVDQTTNTKSQDSSKKSHSKSSGNIPNGPVCEPAVNRVPSPEPAYKINPYDPTHLETVSQFFQLYDERGERFDQEIQTTDGKIKETELKIQILENEKEEINLRLDELLYRELLVILEGSKDCSDLSVYVSYVVKHCSWKSCYDIRVSNQTGVMQICYFASIRQLSNEDWYQPKQFAVSTMEPGVGGTVPDLAIQRFQFRNPSAAIEPSSDSGTSPVSSMSPVSPKVQPNNVVMASPSMRRGNSMRSVSFRKSKSISVDFLSAMSIPESVKTSTTNMNFSFEEQGTLTNNRSSSPIGMSNNSGAGGAARPNDLSIKCSTTESDSVQYEIPRSPIMVTCDNKEVKVMIGQYSFEPIYNYITVPRLSPHAYQRAYAINNSGVTFLTGQANIFIDGCFIGKTNIKDIHPSEEFICNLGVDKSISIRYEPLIKVRDNKKQNLCVTYRQVTQITNNNARIAKVTMVDRIPMTMEGEKIKVNLIEPSLKADKGKSIRKNDLGELNWDHEIQPRETKEAVVKFTVEHPVDREIEITNVGI